MIRIFQTIVIPLKEKIWHLSIMMIYHSVFRSIRINFLEKTYLKKSRFKFLAGFLSGSFHSISLLKKKEKFRHVRSAEMDIFPLSKWREMFNDNWYDAEAILARSWPFIKAISGRERRARSRSGRDGGKDGI